METETCIVKILVIRYKDIQAYDQTIFKGQTECNLNTLTPYIYTFLWKHLYT